MFIVKILGDLKIFNDNNEKKQVKKSSRSLIDEQELN